MRRPDEIPFAAAAGAERPSKTRRKAEMNALQNLGETLTRVDPARLPEFGLPERLAEAIAAASRITQRGARRRQLQFIGRIMRELDPATVSALRAWLADRG